MLRVVRPSSQNALSTALFVLSAALIMILFSASMAPISAQEGEGSVSYRTPPIPFREPQLAQSAPQAPTAVAETTVVQGTVVDSAVVDSAAAPTAVPPAVAVQPTVRAPAQAPVSVGLASSATSRPNESASTIVERITASSAPEAANVLGVARMDGNWQMPVVGTNERWLRVDLSEQMLYAYEGSRSIASFITSTGTERYPTVTGLFRVRMKVSEQTMSGGTGSEAYWLPGVKWVMYFHSGYAFHGTYWHTNFGTPQSHGCVNLTEENAKWLFDFAGPVWDGQTTWFPSTENNQGSLVLVHQ